MSGAPAALARGAGEAAAGAAAAFALFWGLRAAPRRRPPPPVELMRLADAWPPFVATATLLGANGAGGAPAGRLALALAANLAGFAFGFMLNDVEDAAADARNPAHKDRNPVAAGRLSAGSARAWAWAAGAAALAAYAALGPACLVLGASVVFLGWAYSGRTLRLKGVPFVELAAHAFGGGAAQILCGALAAGGDPGQVLGPAAAVAALSVYGQLGNQLRDLACDEASGLRPTAAVLGRPAARALQAAALLAAVALLTQAVYGREIPFWAARVGVGAVAGALAAAWLSGRGAPGGPSWYGVHGPVLLVGLGAMAAWAAALRRP